MAPFQLGNAFKTHERIKDTMDTTKVPCIPSGMSLPTRVLCSELNKAVDPHSRDLLVFPFRRGWVFQGADPIDIATIPTSQFPPEEQHLHCSSYKAPEISLALFTS